MVKDLHLPNHNFVGPFTSNDERLDLNYEGKVGTKNYFLPASMDDYTAFKHDLLYYSPDNIVKGHADLKFLKGIFKKGKLNVDKSIPFLGIIGQYIKRVGTQTVVAKFSKDEAVDASSELIKIFKKTPFAKLFGKRGKVPENLKNWINTKSKYYFGRTLQPARGRGAVAYRNIIEKKVIPYLFMYGTGYFTKPIGHIKDAFEAVYYSFVENEDYKKVLDAFNKVNEKYKKYLDEVGYFTDDKTKREYPYYNRFIIKKYDDIDGEKAKEFYKDFHKEFNNYKKFINDMYKHEDDFVEYDINPLNEKELDKVAKPSMSMSDSDFARITEEFKKKEEERIKKINEKIEQINKNIDEEGDIYPDIVDIQKELSPSPTPTAAATPTITPSPSIAIEEDDDDIPINISEQIEYLDDDDETIIVMPDDIKREITAILQKRKEKPFESTFEII
jgi:hypothetical protein